MHSLPAMLNMFKGPRVKKCKGECPHVEIPRIVLSHSCTLALSHTMTLGYTKSVTPLMTTSATPLPSA